MNEIIKCILERRSIRKFSSKEINKKDLDLILKAGEYAPSAESEYRWEFFSYLPYSSRLFKYRDSKSKTS